LIACHRPPSQAGGRGNLNQTEKEENNENHTQAKPSRPRALSAIEKVK